MRERGEGEREWEREGEGEREWEREIKVARNENKGRVVDRKKWGTVWMKKTTGE